MALFSDLFNESATAETNDFLKDLPLAKFDENASYLDCGSKGVILAESGWLEICESVRNDILNEDVYAAKATVSNAFDRVAAFLRKIPEMLKKIAQIIMGTINKFLVAITSLVKQDKNLDVEAAKKGLARYNELHKDKLFVNGFTFKGKVSDGVAKFVKAIEDAKKAINSATYSAQDTPSEGNGGGAIRDVYTKEWSDKQLNRVRSILVTGADGNDVSTKDFKAGIAKYYGSDNKENKVEVTAAFLDEAGAIVKAGYKEGQKSARDVYQNAKKAINEWIAKCDNTAKYYDGLAKKAKESKDEKSNNADHIAILKANANAAETAGRMMTSVSGMMSSYTGAYCGLLHQNYNTYKSAITTCMGYAKVPEKKAKEEKKPGQKNEAVTIESSDSLFGLDLI